jgi:hypothetical protein
MTDTLLTQAHDDSSWRGFTEERHHQLARRALEQFPDDPIVLYRCLRLWHSFAMPVGQEYSSCGPSRAEGRVLLDRVLAAGQRVLDASPRRDSLAMHALFFWVNQLRALDRIVTEPSAEELATAARELDAVYDEIAGHLEDKRDHWDILLRYQTLARRRSWELLRCTPSEEPELRDKLAAYIDVFDNCLEWPIAPLARDPVFQARITAELAARAAARSHPAPKCGGETTVWLAERVVDAPDEAESLGRLRVLLWLGVDEPLFTTLAAQAIGAPAPLLEVLLGLGFDPNAPVHSRRNEPDPSGYTLLHLAVASAESVERCVEAVRLLIAAGADPKRVNVPAKGDRTKQQSALELAKTRKKRAVIAALEGGTAAPSRAAAALATKLRAAAKAIQPKDLAWAGSSFGVSAPDPVKAIEAALERSPETAAEILDDLRGSFVFHRYVVARVLRAAGYVIDRKLRAPAVLDGDLTVSGDLVVDGALVDQLGGSTLAIAGDLRVGSLVTESDVIVGGSLCASELVWGNYNDGSLVVEGEVAAPLLVMTDHTFEHEGKRRIAKELVDPDRDELARLFVAGAFADGSLDRERVVKLVKKKAPILLGHSSRPPTS